MVYPAAGEESCSSCPTLQNYVSNTSLFTNNSEFLFMSGNYFLNASLPLENLTNVTWKSERIRGAKIILQVGELCFKNVKAFSLSGFDIYSEDSLEFLLTSSVEFYLCTAIISNTAFNTPFFMLYSSVAAVKSTVEFKGIMYFNGSLSAYYSAIIFRGYSVFEPAYRSAVTLLKTSSLKVTGLLNFTEICIDDSSVLKLVAPVILLFNNDANTIFVQDNYSTFNGICKNLDFSRICPASLKLSMVIPLVNRFAWNSMERTMVLQ